jgi:NitT/TauT family transport system ATP-binding protein
MRYPGSNGSIEAIRAFSLRVATNEIVCLLGPSGSGKTTVLNLAAGFFLPTDGEVLIDGKPLVGPTRRCGVVFQDDATFPWMNVQENVEYALDSRKYKFFRRRDSEVHESDLEITSAVADADFAELIAGAERRVPALARVMKRLEVYFAKELRRVQQETAIKSPTVVENLLSMVGLLGVRKLWPRQLSGGMRKRLDLARAYAADPEVLLMDEPFGSLDVLTKQEMQLQLLKLWKMLGKTVLFVTHDVEEALFLGNRLAVMSPSPGRVRRVYEVPFPFPRTPELKFDERFVQLRREISELLMAEQG